jgi:DNA-binding NarL/FixJ family response regulator
VSAVRIDRLRRELEGLEQLAELIREITDALKQRDVMIARLACQGVALNKIASAANLSSSRVHQIAKKIELPVERTEVPEDSHAAHLMRAFSRRP